jgi:multidrug resistance protein MdtO
MAGLQIWMDRFWQDLQPTPGRLGITLRIVLATVLTLILLLTLRVPSGAFGLYFIFLLSRESPTVSLRFGVVALLSVSVAVAAQLAVVIVTDNDPMARVVSIALIALIAGMIIGSTTLPSIGVILGFVFCSAIASWERHRPADTLVKGSLWLVASCALGIGCAVLVEYAFGSTNPVKGLEQQLQMRYKALEKLFHSVASAAAPEDVVGATVQVSRLAAAGQSGMQELYNAIVERNMDGGDLPVSSRVHITMLAQLMDLSVAFGSQIRSASDPQIRERCARVAQRCQDLRMLGIAISQQSTDVRTDPPLTLLDRIETVLHDLQSRAKDIARTNDKELVALSPKRVPLLVPNAVRNADNVAFALKLSLCVTICYVFYHAVDWTGISTCVTTVIITALSTRGDQSEVSAKGLRMHDRRAYPRDRSHSISISSHGYHHIAGGCGRSGVLSLSLVCNRAALLLCGPTNRASLLSRRVRRLRVFDRPSSRAGSLCRDPGGPDCHVDYLR